MSKLLKRVIDKHMPHLSHRMTAEAGYDSTKHLTVRDLHKAKLISDKEKAAIDSCLDDLSSLDDNSSSSNAAKVLKGVEAGEGDRDSLNDDAFIKALMGADPEDAVGSDDRTASDQDINA
jgi:hypothetical protein